MAGFDLKKFNAICDEIEVTHLGLKTICKNFDTTSTSFFNFLEKEKENSEIIDRYTRARERQADYLFDLQREIVFERGQDHTPFTGSNVVNRDKLIAETIKWQAGKLRPKKYGDKLEIDQKTEVSGTITQITGMRIVDSNNGN
jgi:hypothetical protein